MHGWAKIGNAAKYADVSKRTIRNWIKNGLPYSRMPQKLILIKLSDLDEFIEKFKVNEKVETNRKINSIVDSICKNLDLK